MKTKLVLSLRGLPLLLTLGCGGASANGAPSHDHAEPGPSSSAAPAPIAAGASECGPRQGAPALRPLSGRSGGSLTLAEVAGKRVAYVADEENGVVRSIDAEGLEELAVTEVEGKPAQVLPLSGGRLAITLRDKNRIVIFEAAAAPDQALVYRCSRPTYAEPFGLAVSADGATLAATSGWDHRLAFLDASSLEPIRTVDVAAEPRGVLLSEDGRSAYVSHLFGGVVTVVPLGPKGQPKAVFVRPPRPEVGKPQQKKTRADEELERPKAQTLAAGQGYAIVEASLGKTKDMPWPARVFVPMASSDPMRFGAVSSFPGVYGGGGGVAVIGAFVAVLDPVAGGPLGGEVAPLRQARPEDCILPRSAAVSGTHLYVTCLGTNRVVELDLRSADPITAESRRFETGEGPTGVVVDEAAQRALVFSQFSLELTVIELSADPRGPRVQALPLARPVTPALDEQAALGRTLFHATRDVRLSFDGRACASCHPEGRADSLTWSTPDGPRQTMFLAGRLEGSAPFGWFGEHPTVKQHVRFAVKRLGGSGLEDDAEDARDLAALLAYLQRLPTPSREGALVDPGVQDRRERGKALFEAADTGCGSCHVAGTADHARHDVGSGVPGESSAKFETPSLRLLAGGAPYFHDGRYHTLDAMLADPKSKMGRSSQLSPDDRAALVAYLESL